ARRICREPLECRRPQPGYCELTLVRIGGCRSAGVLPHWAGAGNAADAGRRGRHRGTSWHATLGGDGADNWCYGTYAGTATARRHLCAASSRVYAPDGTDSSEGPRRDSPGDLRYGRHWSRHGTAHSCLRCALWAPGRARVLGHGCAVRASFAVDLEAEATRVGRKWRNKL